MCTFVHHTRQDTPGGPGASPRTQALPLRPAPPMRRFACPAGTPSDRRRRPPHGGLGARLPQGGAIGDHHMAPLHRVYFLGNVIQDPEAWSAPNGSAVARCGLAVPTRLRQGDTWHEDVCCIEVLAFGRQADTVKATLRPGCTVLIEGRVQWWRVAQDQPSRNTKAVIAERIQCLSRPQEAPRPAAGGRGARRGARLVGGAAAAAALPG